MEFISINTDTDNSPYTTKKIFDTEINIDSTEVNDLDKIYKYALTKTDKKQIYIFKDLHLSNPIMSGINENITLNGKNNLKILYFSNYHDLDEIKNNNLSSLMGISNPIFNKHSINISHEQIILLGLNDEDYDLDLDGLTDMNIEYYTLSLLKKKGIDIILNNILDKNKNSTILAYFNIEVFVDKICPSVNRRNLSINNIDLDEQNNKKNSGLTYEQLELVTKSLKNNIKYLLISGFDNKLDNETGFYSRLTSEVVQILYRNIMDIKEKKINVFNENSRFLIFRELKQQNTEDIGWYILRLLSLNDRQEILKSIEDDKIYTINLNDFDNDSDDENNNNNENDDNLIDKEILITATTIDDQNMKSYYHAKSIMDCALFPQEKFLMCFELVNF